VTVGGPSFAGVGDTAIASIEQQPIETPDEVTNDSSSAAVLGGAGDTAAAATDDTTDEPTEAEKKDAGEAFKDAYEESGSLKVGGEVVKDNEKGVQTTGSVDATDPTSISEADPDRLAPSGTTDGKKNTQQTVREYVERREQNDQSEAIASITATGTEQAAAEASSGVWEQYDEHLIATVDLPIVGPVPRWQLGGAAVLLYLLWGML
jgi:hypothetical protein